MMRQQLRSNVVERRELACSENGKLLGKVTSAVLAHAHATSSFVQGKSTSHSTTERYLLYEEVLALQMVAEDAWAEYNHRVDGMDAARII